MPCSYPFETHFANEDGWMDGWMLLSPVAPVRYTLAYTEEDETWSLVLSQAGCYRGTYRVCVLGQGRLCKVKAG